MKTFFHITAQKAGIIFLMLSALVCWSFVKMLGQTSSGSGSNNSYGVFTAIINGKSYTGLVNSIIRFRNRGTFAIISNGSSDTTSTGITTHEAFLFHIFSNFETGSYLFQPPHQSANTGSYHKGIPTLDYCFQPGAPDRQARNNGSVTITFIRNGKASGTFAGTAINSNINEGDKESISGVFEDIPIVDR
jgi:hypothetical protein